MGHPERVQAHIGAALARLSGWRQILAGSQQQPQVKQKIGNLVSGDEFTVQHFRKRLVDDDERFRNHRGFAAGITYWRHHSSPVSSIPMTVNLPQAGGQYPTLCVTSHA